MPSIKNLLSGAKRYLSGGLPSLPNKIDFGDLNAAGEEAGLLARQNWLSKLTRGLSDRPNFHVQDRVLGAVPGAAAGVLGDDKLRSHDGSGADWSQRILSGLGGAYGGGLGLNKALNVGRRYIAGTSPLFGYSLDKPESVVKNLWRYGIKNEPRADLTQLKERAEATGNFLHYDNSAARHELLKRYLGIHTPDAAKDYFRRSADGSYGYNPQTVNPTSTAWKALVDPIAKTKINDIENPAPYSTYAHHNPVRDIFGSHDLRSHAPPSSMSAEQSDAVLQRVRGNMMSENTGSVDLEDLRKEYGRNLTQGNYELGDSWNFALDPHEKDVGVYAKGLAKTAPWRWNHYLSRSTTGATHPTLAELNSSGTIGERLQTSGLRMLMEKLFRQHTPVVRQKFQVAMPQNHAQTLTDEGRRYQQILDVNPVYQ